MNALTIIMIVSALLLAGWFLIMLDSEDSDEWKTSPLVGINRPAAGMTA